MMNKYSKRGFTVAELTIVLVLLAVLSVSIISFVSVIQLHIENHDVLLDVVDDLTYCKKTAVAWFSHFDDEEFNFSVENGELLARNKQTGEGYRLFFYSYGEDKDNRTGMVVAQYDDGRTGTYETKNVTGITFALSADGRMAKCMVSYRTVGAGSDGSVVAERMDFVMARKTSKA